MINVRNLYYREPIIRHQEAHIVMFIDKKNPILGFVSLSSLSYKTTL